MVRHGVFINLGQATFLGTQNTCEVSEVVYCQWDIRCETLTHGLTIFPGLSDSDFFQILFDDVRDAQQHQRALCG